MVERYVPGATPEQLERDASLLASAGGEAARYVGSTFVPEEESCFAWFESESAEAVRAACEQAGIRFARIVEAREVRREKEVPRCAH